MKSRFFILCAFAVLYAVSANGQVLTQESSDSLKMYFMGYNRECEIVVEENKDTVTEQTPEQASLGQTPEQASLGQTPEQASKERLSEQISAQPHVCPPQQAFGQEERKMGFVQRYMLGVHVGMDIGGAVPWPPSNLSSGEMKMSAVPKLNPSLGVSFSLPVYKRFNATAEVTYKQVGIDADAWVSGQQFRVPNPGGKDMLTQFRGTANVVMEFVMLEIPVYVGYSFRGGRDRLYLGAYYSYIFKSHFNTIPLKGMVQNPNDPSEPPILITPDSPVPPDVMPVFDNYLGKWDAGILFGYEWQIVSRVKMTARFSMGFKDIFRKGSNYLEYKMLNMRGTIALSYAFLKYK